MAVLSRRHWLKAAVALVLVMLFAPTALGGDNKVTFPINTAEQQQQQHHHQQEPTPGGRPVEAVSAVGSAVAALEAATSLNDTMSEDEEADDTLDCDLARMRCVYRDGCNRALSFYFESCANQLHDDIHYCPKACHYALVGLMSTDEGKDMMNCKCLESDVFCMRSRRQAEICRSSVEAVLNSDRVSCRAATYICNADTLCGTAYAYYYGLCRRMFLGKKCTKRLMYELDKHTAATGKAAKLNECYCDGPDDHECLDIHRNMKELCFDKNNRHKSKTNGQSTSSSSSGPNDGRGKGESGGMGGGLFGIGGREPGTVYGGGWPANKDKDKGATVSDFQDTTTIHRLPPSVSRASSTFFFFVSFPLSRLSAIFGLAISILAVHTNIHAVW